MGKIYLASQSQSRRQLLQQAKIPYEVVRSSFCDDDIAQGEESIYDYVQWLAKSKAGGVDLAQLPSEGSHVIVAADTIIQTNKSKRTLGKPIDRHDAKRMLTLMQEEDIKIITGMHVRIIRDGQDVDEIAWTNISQSSFSVPDEAMDFYLDTCPEAMYACGACVVEGVGIRYMDYFEGSLAGAIGLDIAGLYRELMG